MNKCARNDEYIQKGKLLPSEKYVLTVEEAASYSMIGQDRLKNIIDSNPAPDWVFKVGSWTRIKRIPFERWVLSLTAI